MVRITRVHGFREYIRQLNRSSTLENEFSDNCLMRGGECECVFPSQCKYIEKDGEKGDGAWSNWVQ